MTISAKIINDRLSAFKRIRSADRTVFCFLIVLNIATALVIGYTRIYLGDAVGHSVYADVEQQIWVTLGVFACYVGLRWLIPGEQAMLKRFNPKPYSLLAISVILGIGIILGAVGFLTIGYGEAESQSNAAFGFIFRLLPYQLAASLLLCIAPAKKRYILLYLAYAVLCAAMHWTGFIASAFFILFMRWHASKPRGKLFSFGVFFLLIAAFFVAPYIYMLKFLLRYGSMQIPYLDTLEEPYVQSLAMLLGRMTSYGNALYLSETLPVMHEAIQNHSSWTQPFIDPIMAVVPRGLLDIHYQNFEQVFVYVIYSLFNSGVSDALTMLGKVMALWSETPLLAILWIVEVIGLVKIAFWLINRLCGINGRIICMLTATGLALGGSLEELGYLLYGLVVISFFRLFMVDLMSILKHWNRVPYDQPTENGSHGLATPEIANEGGK